MRIIPVNIISFLGSPKKSQSIQTSSRNYQMPTSKSSISYPRRYLPDYYPQPADTTRRTYDSFTGMRDKNYLLSVLNKAISDANGNPQKEFSIAMFDMDNFKSVNELLGYQTGDNFIKAISKNILTTSKSNGIYPYGFGGEEFVIVFDKQEEDKQKAIVSQIIRDITDDDYIRSKEAEYRANAVEKLGQYTKMQDMVNQLTTMKTRVALLSELKDNFATLKAKNDPYLQTSIDETNSEIKDLYLELIDGQLSSDAEDKETKTQLMRVREKIEGNVPLGKSESDELDEYLLAVYDRTFEIHQIKKWLNDFDKNSGFSITGGIVRFNKNSLENKTALDVINEVGEVLKNGKNIQKGKGYYNNFY